MTEALKYHSDGYTDADLTVQVCWDADRLDLGRVGIKPAPHRLCTASAKSVDVLEAAMRGRRRVVAKAAERRAADDFIIAARRLLKMG